MTAVRKALWFRSKRAASSDTRTEHVSTPPTLEELGLAHLTHEQRLGLRDDVLAGYYNNETDELFTGFRVSPDDVLVDIGCGSGGPLEFCAKRAGKAYAFDVYQRTIDAARDRLLDRGIDVSHISFMVADGSDLPLPDQTATRVMCLEVLEHVESPDAVVKELVRVAAPGALVLISVPDERGEQLLHHYAPASAWLPPHHIRTFSREDLVNLLTSNGLEIIGEGTSGFFRTLWLALFWRDFKVVGTDSHAAVDAGTFKSNDLLDAWTAAWETLLDQPNGPTLKEALDSILPKSQTIVARKP